MKRSEYKAARKLLYDPKYTEIANTPEYHSEMDTQALERRNGFPGWDPEEPEAFDEAAAPQRPEAEKAEKSEWYEWVDHLGGGTRVSLSGAPRLEFNPGGEFRPAPREYVGVGWMEAIVTGFRRLASARDEVRADLSSALGQVASLRARDITQQEDIRRLAAEFTRIGDLYSAALSGNESLRAEISRLQGEVHEVEELYRQSDKERVQLANEIARLHAKENLSKGNRMRAEARLRGEIESLREESLCQDRGPAPFSRDEWRYDFAGRYMAALLRIGDGPREDAEAAVGAADALLEALESPSKGEAGAEAGEGAEELSRVAGEGCACSDRGRGGHASGGHRGDRRTWKAAAH